MSEPDDPTPTHPNRRDAIRQIAGATLVGSSPPALHADDRATPTIAIDPSPRFEISPFLSMQFMEPLGTTDGSVEAAWDHTRDRWRQDVIDATRALAPAMLRWGGIFTDYYRWREAVGPRDRRVPMLNLLWGGVESNQIGTMEFLDFCKRTAAEPLICVNFESDGRRRFAEAKGSVRTADAREAAAWVAYCNDPNSDERRGHGHPAPHPVRYWQIGNETSYDRRGFDLETAAAKTVEFARAMRRADPDVALVAWGDSGWATRMLEIAGEHVQFLAFHAMFNPDTEEPVLSGELYRRDPAATWEVLMRAWEISDAKIRQMRDSLGGRAFPLAMTECHFTIPGRHRCDVLSTWAAGVAYARILNNHQRHGDILKIATAADFCGTRWQVNALMIPTPTGNAYLMPVARIMQLYRRHQGTRALSILRAPDGLDTVASRDGDTIYLHVVNTLRDRPTRARLHVEGCPTSGGRVFEIADEPTVEISHLNADRVMPTRERSLPPDAVWEFPPASVSAVELALRPARA